MEPNRALLFVDFRHADRARRLRRVELVETEPDLDRHLARSLSGRVGFEADHLTYERYHRLRQAGSSSSLARGWYGACGR